MEQDPRETDSTGKYQNVKNIRNFTSKTSRPCLLRVQNPLRAKPPVHSRTKGGKCKRPCLPILHTTIRPRRGAIFPSSK